MIDLRLIVEGFELKLAEKFPLTEIKAKFERPRLMPGPIPTIRKLGWFGRMGKGVRAGQDLYRIKVRRLGLEILGDFKAITMNPGHSILGCTVTAEVYVKDLVIDKVNIYVESLIPPDPFETVSEIHLKSLIETCTRRLQSLPVTVLPAEPARGNSECLAWGDSESIIKTAVFRRVRLVIMWEIGSK